MTPRRIAFLLPHFRPGGAERVVLNLIGALDRSRYAPHLFMTKVDGRFLDHLPRDVRPVALGANRALFLPRHIAAALAAHDIDIAYSATNAMNLALLRAPTKARRIVSEHTPPRAYLDQAKFSWARTAAMRWLYPRADAIAVPTQAIADELRAVIGPRIAAHILPNPVLAELPAILPPIDPAPMPIRLVSAGRLVPAKGYDTLIAACALLSTAGIAFHLDIYGEGPLRHALQQRIDAVRLGDRIHLRGHADPLDAALAGAGLFVLASRREGFGNVLIEAMAQGIPVLATTGGGPETFLQDGYNGHLVAPDNPVALAAALARLIADPALRTRVRVAALQTATRFTIAGSTKTFSELIDILTSS